MIGELAGIQDETMAVLATILRSGQRVALLDYPSHENSGDSLIFLGTLEYLKRLGVHVDYVADHVRYKREDLTKLVPNGPILINGGGNFGDRWQDIQSGREKIIRDFPDRKIIQLPSSVEFSDGPLLDRAQTILNAHRSLTLLIRDTKGVERTRKLFPNATVVFCPDAAFGYGMIKAAHSPMVDLVIVRRNDSEKVAGEAAFEVGPDTTTVDVDWGLRGMRKIARSVLRIPGAITKRIPRLGVPAYPLVRFCYDAQAKLNVSQAKAILSKGEVVATDRLHATVLAALMGKSVVAMDNANGKVAAITDDYLGRMPGVTFAPSTSEARKLVDLQKTHIGQMPAS